MIYRKYKTMVRQLFGIDGLYVFGFILNKETFFDEMEAVYLDAFNEVAIFDGYHLVWDYYYRKLWFHAIDRYASTRWLVAILLKMFFLFYLIIEFFITLVSLKRHLYELDVTEPDGQLLAEYYTYSDDNLELIWYYEILNKNYTVGRIEVNKNTTLGWFSLMKFIPHLFYFKIMFPSLPFWQIVQSTSLRTSASHLANKNAKLLMEECADRNQIAILAGVMHGAFRKALVFVRTPFMIGLNYIGAEVVVPNNLVRNVMAKFNNNIVSINIPFIHYGSSACRTRRDSKKLVLGYAPEMYSLVCGAKERTENDNLINVLVSMGNYKIFVRRHPQERNLASIYNEIYDSFNLIYSSEALQLESVPFELFLNDIHVWITPFSTTILSALQNGRPVIAFKCIKSPALLDLASMSLGLLRLVENNEEFFTALEDISKIINNPSELEQRTKQMRANLDISIVLDHATRLNVAVSKSVCL